MPDSAAPSVSGSPARMPQERPTSSPIRLGSTVALADSTGTLQTEYSYEPFGNMSVSSSPTTNSYTYTGREFDGLGIDYYRARYYNPQTGRFLSEDPIGFAGGVNEYTYAGDDPEDFIDPFGLDKKAPINLTRLIFNAQNSLPKGCNAAFANGIPNYTNINFFEHLLINPIVQMPNATSLSDPDFGHDAVTSPNTGQITLRANFFNLPSFYQQMTVVHEGIHSYTGWSDAQVMSNLSIPNDGNGTSAITDWITGGCKHQ